MSSPTLSTTVYTHDTIKTERKIKKFDEKRGAFCPTFCLWAFQFSKTNLKKKNLSAPSI